MPTTVEIMKQEAVSRRQVANEGLGVSEEGLFTTRIPAARLSWRMKVLSYSDKIVEAADIEAFANDLERTQEGGRARRRENPQS